MADEQMLNEETPADKKEDESTLKKTVGELGDKVYPYDGQEEDDRTIEELSPAEKASKASGNLAVLEEVYNRANAGVNQSPKEREKDEERVLMVGEAIVQGVGGAENVEMLRKLANMGYNSAKDALNKLKEDGKIKEDGTVTTKIENEEDKEKDKKGSIIDAVLEENKAERMKNEFEAIKKEAEEKFDAENAVRKANFDAERAEVEKSFNENMQDVQSGAKTAKEGKGMDEVRNSVNNAVQEAIRRNKQY